MLSPDFSKIPVELRSLPRWVVWKGAKVPYRADSTGGTASSTDASTWADFLCAQKAYEKGGWSGVGFVLNGDGIVGLDLDKCVHDGKPGSGAMSLLDRIGCQYIELSPSRTGLRAFGFGNNTKGRRGVCDGVNVEIYSTTRYLTVTGRAIRIGPLVDLPGFAELSHSLKAPSPTEDNRRELKHNGCHLLYSSVGIPPNCLPKSEGERNACLFHLARYMKGQMPSATKQELRAVVLEWHQLALPFIGTKDFAVTWADFLRGWESVKHPFGSTLRSILDSIEFNEQLPPGLEGLGYGAGANRLVRICMALQAHQGSAPFFISARQAGELTGMHYTDAARVLVALVHDGVLELVSKGVGKVASRYRFVWETAHRHPKRDDHAAERRFDPDLRHD